jgi:hypothetical protein
LGIALNLDPIFKESEFSAATSPGISETLTALREVEHSGIKEQAGSRHAKKLP